MTVDLFIRGYKADIGVMKDFVRNFKRTLSFIDLDNPTKITTDFTYSATLPGTDTNKMIFGYIEHGTQANVFNPAARYEFLLNVNGILWLHGDVKLDKISEKAGDVTFSCSFYSILHEKIVALGKKDLKELSCLADSSYYNHVLDREAMANFWVAKHPFSNMIRYVPCRAGMYNDFQSDKMMRPVYNGADPPQLIGYGAAELGSDYDEYATREYRIEYQRPALSLKELLNGIASDNDISIDASLMASPYIDKGWMLCPQMVTELVTENCFGSFSAMSHTTNTTAPGYNLYGMYQTSASPAGTFHGTTITTDDNPHSLSLEFCIKLRARAQYSSSMGAYLPYNMRQFYVTRNAEQNQPHLTVRIAGSGVTFEKSILIPMSSPASVFGRGIPWRVENTKYGVYQPKTGISGWEESDWMPIRISFALNISDHANKNLSVDFFFTNLAYHWYSDPTYTDSQYNGNLDQMEIFIKPITDCTENDISKLKDKGYLGETLAYVTQDTGWSPLRVDINSILSKELSQRDLLTDITKMTGCVWDLQNDNIQIKTRNHYFENSSVYDWTTKLDHGSEIEIKPLAYDKGVYTLSYKDGDSLLENQYKSKIGRDWGKQYINTGFQFNSDTESMYESPRYNTVMAKGQRKVIILNGNYEGRIYEQTPYEIPMIETKDNGSPKEGFRYLMDCGLQELEKGENVFITQDSSWMESNDIGGRCWMDTNHYSSGAPIGNNIVIMSAIPLFGTRRNDATFDWAKSSISFSGETDQTYDSSIALYPRFWSNYINSLYNAETQVMTAWFNLSLNDVLTYKFKDFVSINGRLWHVNKIIDFDLSGETLTKCELVEVHNMSDWCDGQNWTFDTSVGYLVPGGTNNSYAEKDNVRDASSDAERRSLIDEPEIDSENNEQE